MADKTVLDPNIISDKESIRKNIRIALTNKASTKFLDRDLKTSGLEPIPDLLRSFVLYYRAGGGKYILCSKSNLITRLVQLIKGQNYFNILNTNFNLKHYLDKHQIRYVEAINLTEPADAALLFSDMLIARNGSIGFTQSQNLYPSVKNIAKDLIIISSTRFLFSDIEKALDYRKRRYPKTTFAMTEFLRPVPPVEVEGIIQHTPFCPRYILLLVDEGVPCSRSDTRAMSTQKTSQPDSPTAAPQKKAADEMRRPDNPTFPSNEEFAY